MRKYLASALVFVVLVAARPALSCSIVYPEGYVGSAEERRDVRKTIEHATVIVDGEVIRPWTEDRPALVRVVHVLKGAPGEFILVGGPGAGRDCSIALDQQGERRRMILNNGPDRYDLFADGFDTKLEDRVLHSDRRKVWPYRRGTATSD